MVSEQGKGVALPGSQREADPDSPLIREESLQHRMVSRWGKGISLPRVRREADPDPPLIRRGSQPLRAKQTGLSVAYRKAEANRAQCQWG